MVMNLVIYNCNIKDTCQKMFKVYLKNKINSKKKFHWDYL